MAEPGAPAGVQGPVGGKPPTAHGGWNDLRRSLARTLPTGIQHANAINKTTLRALRKAAR